MTNLRLIRHDCTQTVALSPPFLHAVKETFQVAHLERGPQYLVKVGGPDVQDIKNHLEKRVLEVETCAEQGGVHCPQGQQTLERETNQLL